MKLNETLKLKESDKMESKVTIGQQTSSIIPKQNSDELMRWSRVKTAVLWSSLLFQKYKAGLD